MKDPADPNLSEPTVAMDLATFRSLVDTNPPGIASCGGDLAQLYDYVGLADTGSHQRDEVSKALYARIRAAFTSGHEAVWRAARSLQTDLIREHVLRGVALDPYFEVLDHLRDAMRSEDKSNNIRGDWATAVVAARDHVEVHSWGTMNREMTYAREFVVAEAAKALERAGFGIDLRPGHISLGEDSEGKLVQAIEALIIKMGGLNVARRIFDRITPAYDANLGRYHLVPNISSIGGGKPQVPWGYLLQLAVKHLAGDRPLDDSDTRWRQLESLATAYAAVIDVQPYSPMAYATFDADRLLLFLRELALYDTLFRMPQLRPSDVERLISGFLDFVDPSASTKRGWTLDQALMIIAYLLDPIREARGPIILNARDIAKAVPAIPRAVVRTILDDVLCHGASGPNQHFSRPTDAPTVEDRTFGITFGERPLIKLGNRYVMIDRSVCAPAFLEALLAAYRFERKGLDDDVGRAVERFVEGEFAAHGVPTRAGDYDHDKEHGECDLVAETSETLIFFELKKKALTRRARAGMDANLLLDLAGSLLQAHAQAGWHELRIRHAGILSLDRADVRTTLSLDRRSIEKVALSMLDYGSFQDRIVLKHFLEATLNASFHPHDTSLTKKFSEINASLAEISQQLAIKYPGETRINQPFFECWFISVPQLLVLLDGVDNADAFRQSLWSCRHFTTGATDLYYELSRMRQLRTNNPIRSL